MPNVNEVYITKEVADKLNINTSYLIRLAKSLLECGKISPNDMRLAGKSTYIFNDIAITNIANSLKRK